MKVRSVLAGLVLSVLVISFVTSPVYAETLTRGAYFCAEYQHRPGYYKTSIITEIIADLAGYGAVVYGSLTGPGAVATGTTARYVTKQILEWVPPSTTCIRWEQGSRMDGNQYQQ